MYGINYLIEKQAKEKVISSLRKRSWKLGYVLLKAMAETEDLLVCAILIPKRIRDKVSIDRLLMLVIGF